MRSERRPNVKGLLLVGTAVLSGVLLVSDALRPLGVAGVLTVLVGSMFVNTPEKVLLAFLVMRPLADVFVHFSVGPLSLGQTWSLVFLVMLTVYLVGHGPSQPLDTSLGAPIAGLLVGYAALTFWRPDMVAGIGNEARLAAWLLLIPCGLVIARTRDGLRRIESAGLALGVVTIAAIGISLATTGFGATYYFAKSSHADSLMAGPHGIAAMAVIAMYFPMRRLLTGQGRLWSFLLMVGLLVGVLVSLVRTAWVAAVILFIGFVYQSMRGRRVSGVVLGVLAATIAGGVSGYFVQGAVIERLLGTAGTVSPEWSLQVSPTLGSGRLLVWQSVADQVAANPWLLLAGGGAGHSIEIMERAVGLSVWAHNDFLELLITGGLTLIVAYVLLLTTLFKVSMHHVGTAPCEVSARSLGLLRFALVAYTAMSFLNGVLFAQGSVALALVIVLAVSIHWHSEMNREGTVDADGLRAAREGLDG